MVAQVVKEEGPKDMTNAESLCEDVVTPEGSLEGSLA